MERRGVKVNIGKVKILVSGEECDSAITLGNTSNYLSGRMLHMPPILYVARTWTTKNGQVMQTEHIAQGPEEEDVVFEV